MWTCSQIKTWGIGANIRLFIFVIYYYPVHLFFHLFFWVGIIDRRGRIFTSVARPILQTTFLPMVC